MALLQPPTISHTQRFIVGDSASFKRGISASKNITGDKVSPWKRLLWKGIVSREANLACITTATVQRLQ